MEQLRQLVLDDLPLYLQMETGIEDDYMITVFERLTMADSNYLYGLFIDNQLVSVAGYTFFPGGNAMLGRLRSDIRFRKKGYATRINQLLIEKLVANPRVTFIGGYTNQNNLAAQGVLGRLQFKELKTQHSFPCIDLNKVGGEKGPIWQEITSNVDKRKWIALEMKKGDGIYPFECYYPFPYSDALLTENKLHESRVFISPNQQHVMIISNDYKGEELAQVRYFANDLFVTPGFFETIKQYLEDNPDRLPWFDFNPEQFKCIPHYTAFRVEDPWILFGHQSYI